MFYYRIVSSSGNMSISFIDDEKVKGNTFSSPAWKLKKKET